VFLIAVSRGLLASCHGTAPLPFRSSPDAGIVLHMFGSFDRNSCELITGFMSATVPGWTNIFAQTLPKAFQRNRLKYPML